MSVGSGATSLSFSADTRVPSVLTRAGWYAAFIDIFALLSAYDRVTLKQRLLCSFPLSQLWPRISVCNCSVHYTGCFSPAWANAVWLKELYFEQLVTFFCFMALIALICARPSVIPLILLDHQVFSVSSNVLLWFLIYFSLASRSSVVPSSSPGQGGSLQLWGDWPPSSLRPTQPSVPILEREINLRGWIAFLSFLEEASRQKRRWCPFSHASPRSLAWEKLNKGSQTWRVERGWLICSPWQEMWATLLQHHAQHTPHTKGMPERLCLPWRCGKMAMLSLAPTQKLQAIVARNKAGAPAL